MTIPTIPSSGGGPAYAGPTLLANASTAKNIAGTPTTSPTQFFSPAPAVAPSTALPKVDTKTPIAAARISSTSTTYPAPVASNTASTNLGSSLASIQGQLESLQKEAEKLKAAETTQVKDSSGLKGTLSKILGLSDQLAGKSGRAYEIQQEEGVFKKKKAATDLSNEYLSKTKYYDDLIEKRRKNTSGSFGGAVEQDVANIERQKNSELADIAIQYKIANDDYTGAFEIAKAKVDAEFEPIQAQIDTLKTYYSLAQNDMTDSEKLQAQAEIQRQESELDFKRQKELYAYKQQIDQSDPGTLNGKPQTATQLQVQGYADRTAQSGIIIDTIGSNFTGASSLVGQNLPNILKTSERQQYEQAQRNFVNAVLRRESGAVISDEEFANARAQYFPQPGDSAKVVEQKAANRETVINNLYQQANISRPALPGQIIEDGSGTRFVVGIDGELEEI